MGPSLRTSCSVLEIALTAALILQFVPGAVFSALRAYVLSRSKLLGLLVLVLSLAPVGANLVPYGYQFSGKSVPPFGCLESADTSEAIDLRFGFILVSRVPLIIADMILIYVTWAKLRSRDALKDIRQSKKMSLSDVLFRDGTQYFVVLFILNVLHFVFSLTALAVTENGTSYLTVFTAPLTAILISRFLLDLQEANQAVVRVDSDNSSHSPSNPWNDTPSFISSLGAFINPDLGTQSDDELELQYVSRSDGEKELEGGVQVSDSQVAAASSSSSSAAAPSAMCA
ncbi:hypothetical protein C8T65DRAFT_18470 [Cerioporus squamosus]|nr:hypothetical protein C8T65DRAFT_18470 [Cerioporus squamosus]